MESLVNQDELVANLLRSFNQDNMVLYVGSSAIDNGELSEQIYKLPWSCVITTSRKDGFGVEFSEGKTAQRYNAFNMPTVLFNRYELPVIQLYGSQNDLPSDLEDVEEYLRASFEKKQAEKALNRVMSKLDIRSRLIVIGYDENNRDEIPPETFIFLFKEIQGGTVTFFNSQAKNSGILKIAAEKNNYIWHDGKLSDLLMFSSNEYEIDNITLDDESNLFYKGHQPVFIKKSVLSRCRNIAQLLTEEKIREIRPLGRIQQSRWFYNFLNNSSDSPQWYGFLPQSDFYLKRSYEDELISIVKNLLANKNLAKSGLNTPIILEGDPGSSKSVELAALAYKIYKEQINPVIYLNGDNQLFATQSTEIQILDELMQEVEQIGDKDTRFLIIWDSSSYRNVISEAKQLARELENRGRRFLLVCSAYGNSADHNEDENKQYYSTNDENLFFKSDSRTNVFYKNNCYYVSATRALNETEIYTLKQKAKLYAVVDSTEIEKIWSELSENTDVFEYFYRLIFLIRPKLEAGLSKEQRLVSRYVRKQFRLLYEKNNNEPEINPMLIALNKAGITLDETINISEGEEDNIYDLDCFNICIAMFSRFKLDTPYSLALQMLCKNEDVFFGKNTEYNNYELFKLLTTQINYIHYIENVTGRFIFKFRSSLEAEIFLKNNQVNEDKQIEILLDILNIYIRKYKRDNEVDEEIKEAIIKILRMYGPNTDYREFWEGHKYYGQHLSILRKIDTLVNKVYELRVKDRIPDDDGAFALIEISFYRELYGNLWDKLSGYIKTQYSDKMPWDIIPEKYTRELYSLRLNKLSDISDLALDILENLEQQLESNLNQRHFYVQATTNSLTVELARISSMMDSIAEEYKLLADDNMRIHQVKSLSYTQLYPILFKAISASPLNGYLYNALFSLFEKEYGRASDERKLLLLSEVRMFSDDASTLEITSRGSNDRDELGTHIQKITQYSCRYRVSIEDIQNGAAPSLFANLFKKMLDRNNASGICFVCQQELDEAGLSGNKISEYEVRTGKEFELNEEQIETCKRIVNFINNPEYSLCVENSIQALYLLLRVEWMLFNGRPLSIGREWQKTYLKSENWLEIHEICEKYDAISGGSDRPIVTLIYALSKIQINRDYIGAMRTMHKVSDMPNQRMRVPYLICFEPGIAEKYTGSVMSTHNFSGFLKVDGMPRFTEQNQGVKFIMKNLGLRRMPKKADIVKDFELGLSLASQFSARKSSDGGAN